MRRRKNPKINSLLRRRLVERALKSEDYRRALWRRCARDIAFFVDVFCYTYDPKNHPRAPHRPFVLYRYQERTVLQLRDAIGSHDILAEKSRQMGFTWVVIVVFLWFWLFRPGVTLLMGSRKEDLVDKSGDPVSLFWKLDYVLNRLPAWMRPNFTRTAMHLHNDDNGATIDGESTNDDFARGGTRTAIALDEFSAVENGHAILRAVGDATNCCIFFGTSRGASGAYYDLMQKMKLESPERIVRWHWSEHPDKRLGLYTTKDNVDGGEVVILDKRYNFPADYPFVRDGKLRSVAYDAREKRSPNRQLMAQEWDIEYFSASTQWFDQKLLTRLKANCKPPVRSGELLVEDGRQRFLEQRGGRLALWFDWDDRPGVVPGDWDDVSCGCDISMGTAGEWSSNSVASFFRRATGVKVAQFTANNLSPVDFCRYVLALCRWFNRAYLIWETNGPGVLFTTTVRDEGYRNVYMSESSEKLFVSRKTLKPGWYSSKESKKILLTEYANALTEGRFVNPSRAALDECGQYIQQPNGTVEHVRSKNEDPGATGENHGDMVIADALTWRAASDLAKRELAQEPEAKPLGLQSFGGRRERYRELSTNRPRRWGSFA